MKNKKWLKLLGVTMVLVLSMGIFAACDMGNNDDEQVQEDNQQSQSSEESAQTIVDDMTDQARTDVEDGDVTEAKINEAIDFIDSNIDSPFDDETMTGDMIYHSAYLQFIGDEIDADTQPLIAKLGQDTYAYVTDIFTETNDADSETSRAVRTEIDTTIDSVTTDQDELVTDFINMYNSNTGNTNNTDSSNGTGGGMSDNNNSSTNNGTNTTGTGMN